MLCCAVLCRARRRLPGARLASPWRQRLLGAAAGGPRAAPAGRCLAAGVGWRDGCRPVLPSRSLPGRSDGRRCVPALPAESPGMWETGTGRQRRDAVSRAYRARTLRTGALLRVTLAVLQVSFIANLAPVRREGVGPVSVKLPWARRGRAVKWQVTSSVVTKSDREYKRGKVASACGLFSWTQII